MDFQDIHGLCYKTTTSSSDSSSFWSMTPWGRFPEPSVASPCRRLPLFLPYGTRGCVWWSPKGKVGWYVFDVRAQKVDCLDSHRSIQMNSDTDWRISLGKGTFKIKNFKWQQQPPLEANGSVEMQQRIHQRLFSESWTPSPALSQVCAFHSCLHGFVAWKMFAMGYWSCSVVQ